MKRLTAITIILSVSALVAAFFGMNVQFPTENTIIGFYVAISISIIVSVIMSLYFNKKKWF